MQLIDPLEWCRGKVLGWQVYKFEDVGSQLREGDSVKQVQKEGEDVRCLPYHEKSVPLAGFMGKKAGLPEEQAKHFKWALCDWILDGIVNTKFTDVAQVADAA
ncbi:hypothetical protein Tco_0494218 [Tanacetum coccineum]